MTALKPSAYLGNGWANTLLGIPFSVSQLCVQPFVGDPGDAGTINLSDVTERAAATLSRTGDGKLSITGLTVFVAVSAEIWTHIGVFTGFDGDPAAEFLFGLEAKAAKQVAAGDRVNLSAMDIQIPVRGV